MNRRTAAAAPAALIAIAILSALHPSAQSPRSQPPGPQIPAAVRDQALRSGRARVIVELRLPDGPHITERRLPNAAAVGAQRRAIAATANQLLATLPAADHRVVRRYETVPYVALEVNPAALSALERFRTDIVRVLDDVIVYPVLAESVPLIQADQAWDVGYDGSGTTIAVLDTGVDANHPFLAAKVIEEACYSSTVAGLSQSVCPNGLDEQIGPGAGAPCARADCLHGTHVAGIAAGNGASSGQSGVAKNAQLMAVQVFAEIIDPAQCGGAAPCLGAFSSDIVAGLERVYVVAGLHNIAAVNMSLAGGLFAAACDDQPYKPVIDNLRSIDVATVAASGNNGSMWSIGSPACVSSAVSVGSVTKTDTISWFSNVSSFLSLLAPGESILSSVPAGGFAVQSGTSMAAPHVAGTFALLRQASPGQPVGALLSALQQTGTPIADTRFFGTATVARVNVVQALASLVAVNNPVPIAWSVSPAVVRAGTGPLTLTIAGSGFNAFSTVLWNGTARTTKVISTAQIQASIPAADVSSAGSAQVSVTSPPPGGGTSSSLMVTVSPPPLLTVDATTVGPGNSVTVTLANGFGGATDWLAFAQTGSVNASYLKSTYVGAGITSRTWTVTMPPSGQYEFRLFLNGGYVRAATSPTVTAASTNNGAPVVTSLAPAAAVVGGPAFTLNVNGSGFVGQSVVRWNGADRPTTYVSSMQIRAAIGAADVAVLGIAQVTVFTPAPGGGTSSALTFTVSPPPSLSVSATTVTVGNSVTMTLTNGLGGSLDWLALAATAAANTSYVQRVYVGAGVTTRTWTVTMPSTPGTYEFRLFLNGGYTRAATSPSITVVAGPNAVPTLTSISPVSTPVGSAGFTLTADGSGFSPTSIVRWNGADRPTTFVSSTRLRAAIPGSDLSALGTAQVSVFSPGSGGGLSSPLPFTITEAAKLTVNATQVAPGASVTVTLTNGFGGSGDWLSLAPSTAINASYVQRLTVGAGVTTMTWTVAMPATPGNYEFRLFLNNGYTRAATSPIVTVVPSAANQ